MYILTQIFSTTYFQAQLNGFQGPTLGPKEAQANPREFTDEQLRHGRIHGI